jgi:flagellin
MSVGIPSANPAYSLQSVLSAQLQLLTTVAAETSGTKFSTSVSSDPSGAAIYNFLTAQAQGADTANQNISDASNAIDVAQGATSTIQTVLSQVNSLAIEANNGFNSPADNAALQAQVTQSTQEINQIAGETNFNGVPLLNGTNSGTTPATPAAATVTNNDATNAGGGVVSSASASGASTSGTFNVTVNGSGTADVTYTDSTTQSTSVVGSFAAGSSTTYNGTTISFGAFSASDAGSSATIQATAATAGSTAPSVTIQSGANEGQTTSISLPNATTTGLGITNLDVTNAASATNTEGQVSAAQAALGQGDANLGAQSDGLGYAFQNNATLSNNLTASASAIGDTNTAQAVTASNQASIQQQISIAVLARANADAGHLSSFLSQYA